mmetsp:Transcript_2429/g.11060  ORF Transcript_2429/g.11060 Transcript_2429/m.11060 type:complete len:221 (+) Transcript_2429:580-1242(+)
MSMCCARSTNLAPSLAPTTLLMSKSSFLLLSFSGGLCGWVKPPKASGTPRFFLIATTDPVPCISGVGCPSRWCSAVTRCCSTSICSYSAAVDKSLSLPVPLPLLLPSPLSPSAALWAASFFRRFRCAAVSFSGFRAPACISDCIRAMNASSSGTKRGCVPRTGLGGGVSPWCSRLRFMRVAATPSSGVVSGSPEVVTGSASFSSAPPFRLARSMPSSMRW